MRIKNITGTAIYLSFVPIDIPPFSEVEIENNFINHPSLLSLLRESPVSIQISDQTTAYVIPQADLVTKLELDVHTRVKDAHHTSANDPTTNEKNALDGSLDPSGSNPFYTRESTENCVTDALNEHLAHYDHSPNVLTNDQKDAIINSILPKDINPLTTISHTQSLISASIVTHTTVATAHHTNANDPTSDEKAALVGTGTPATGNRYVTNDTLTTHAGNATVHHTNVNDPTSGQKEALEGSYGTPGVANTYVTSTDPLRLTTDQKAAIAAADPSPDAENPFVTSDDPRLVSTGYLTTDEKEGLAHASPLPSEEYPLVTTGYALLPTDDEKDALAGTGTPTSANKYVTNDTLTTHTGTATAHHTNVNDPTSDEKAALAGTGTPAVGNKYVTNDTLTSHTGTATAHHTNVNDPSIDEKAALVGTDGVASGSNKYVTDSDSRLDDSRVPTAHASSHTSGADDIQLATNAQNGLMTSSLVGNIETLENDKNDVTLSWTSTTSLTLSGIESKEIRINGVLTSLSTPRVLSTSDNVLTSSGTDSTAAMILSTLYYLYASNVSASYAPDSVRASTSAPSFDSDQGKYALATSGNGKNWVFVGWAMTDGSVHFSDAFSVASHYNAKSITSVITGTDTGPASANDAWEDITGLSKSILLPENWELEIKCSTAIQATTATSDIFLGVHDGFTTTPIAFTDVQVTGMSQCVAGFMSFIGSNFTPSFLTYKLQHKFSDKTGSLTEASKGLTIFTRRP